MIGHYTDNRNTLQFGQKGLTNYTIFAMLEGTK
jgi:hypothetical protein